MIAFLGYVLLLTAGLFGTVECMRRTIRTSSRGLFLIGFSFVYFSIIFYLARLLQ
jgi:hypothetical protein